MLNEWRKVNVTSIFKQGKEKDIGNYWPVSLTSILGKVMEQIILDVTTKHGLESLCFASIGS